MTVGAMGVLLGTDLDVEVQLSWALRLAEARQLDLQVFQRVESKEERITEIPFEGSGNGSATEIVDLPPSATLEPSGNMTSLCSAACV